MKMLKHLLKILTMRFMTFLRCYEIALIFTVVIKAKKKSHKKKNWKVLKHVLTQEKSLSWMPDSVFCKFFPK